MAKSARIRTSDWRTLFRLVQECRDLGDDECVWREHLFRQLGRLTGADLVVGGEVMAEPNGEMRPLSTVGCGWEHGFNPHVIAKALEEDLALAISPFMASYFARPTPLDGQGLTRTDLTDDDGWYTSDYWQKVHREIGVDHTLVSFVATPGTGSSSGVTLSRERTDRRDFTARHRAIVGEAQRLIAPLVGGALARFADPSPSALAPRVRAVLACLLDGDSDKQMAARLGLSLHTVNQYVKAIYTHFGVNSRPELLARWIRRGWGNKGGWRQEC